MYFESDSAQSEKPASIDQKQFKIMENRDHTSGKPRTSISRDDVILAFKIILGRTPENDEVIADHQLGSLEELRVILLKSKEFTEKYKAITSSPRI
jgi:hypothetical protein